MPKKKDDISYGVKLIRLFADLLFTRNSLSLKELAKNHNCSKQTIRRIIDDISNSYSVSIQEETIGRKLFFHIARPKQVNPLPLSQDELATLEMCQAFTRHLLGNQQFMEATKGLIKSHALLPDGAMGLSGSEFASFNPGSIDYSPHQETLKSLIEAITEKRVCEIAYQSIGADQPRTYCIMPLKIFSHKDTVYVHACRSDEKGNRKSTDEFFPLLSVHRFKKVKVLQAVYELPKDYDFEKQFTPTFGVIKGKPFRVKLELWGWAAGYVTERIYSPNQRMETQPDGKVLLEFDATSSDEVLSWVLSLRDKARILGPEELKMRMSEKLHAMLDIYAESLLSG